MLDVGKQFNDNARRLDTCKASVHEGINGIRFELRATGPAVQQGLSSLGDGLASLHESFRQTRGTLQGKGPLI